MSYTDLRDFEAEYTREVAEGFTVEIEKLGGGMVGRPYKGAWRYRARNQTDNGDVIVQGQDLDTGTPKTHVQVVEIVLDLAEVDGMSLREWVDAMTMD